jgi:hypothetical protein
MMRSLGELIFGFADRPETDLGFRLARLWLNWRQTLGQTAPYARPLGHKRTILLVGVDDSLAMQESRYEAQDILDRVNSFLGQLYFDKVHFDLLQGKTPLDEVQGQAPTFWPPRAPRIKDLGRLGLDARTPLGRCYQAYVRNYACKG